MPDTETDRNGRKYLRARLNIEVQVIHSADGEDTPVMIKHGSRVYHVFSSRKISDEIRYGRSRLQTYRVNINGNCTYVYCEDGVWFVREKKYIDEMHY